MPVDVNEVLTLFAFGSAVFAVWNGCTARLGMKLASPSARVSFRECHAWIEAPSRDET